MHEADLRRPLGNPPRNPTIPITGRHSRKRQRRRPLDLPGIGNYTDHIANGSLEGSAEIYFDDSAIARRRLSLWSPEVASIEPVAVTG